MNPGTLAEILWLLSGYALLISPPFVAWVILKWRAGARPPSLGEWRLAGEELAAWATGVLRDDWDTVRDYSAVTAVLRALETVAMLGLLLRFVIHFIAYKLATSGDDPDEWTLGFGDPVGPRPTWHRLMASLSTAMLVAWFATRYPVGVVDASITGLQYWALMAWLWLNCAAAVCDPILVTWKPLTSTVTKRYT